VLLFVQRWSEMPVRVELSPEEEALLRERAAERGELLETTDRVLLRSLLAPSTVDASQRLPAVVEDGTFHRERWERVLASIRSVSVSAPVLPTHAQSREVLYSEHD
jgi:hypothetical protein